MVNRILLVEDDADARDALALLLANGGYDVETAPDGKTALAKAATFKPDVLVCDWLLPDTDGPTIARSIQTTSGIPIIFITAHSLAELRNLTMDLRVHAYLPKPIDIDRLSEVLGTLS
jgi:DNA-binding response OmpR family regulator